MAVRTKFTGDESDLLRAQQRINSEASKTETSFGRVADEAKKLGAQGQQAFSAVNKAVQDYHRRITSLNERLREGKITQEQYAQAAKEAQDEAQQAYDQNESDLREQIALIKQAADEERRRGRQAARVYDQTRTPLERLNRRTRELRDLWKNNAISLDTFKRASKTALQDYRNELNKTEKEAKETFDLSGLQSYIGGFATLTAAAAGVRAIYAEIRQEQEAAAQANQEVGRERGSLAQVATSRQDFSQLVGLAQELRARGAAEQEGLAEQIVFALRSTGQEDDFDTFARAGASGLVQDVSGLVNSVDTLVKAFGREDAGNADRVLSQGLVASGFTQRSLEEVLQATASVGASARAAGIDNEQSQAAIATIAGPRGSVSEAASRVNAFLASLDKAGIEITSLGDGIAQVQARIDAGETERDVLGDRQESLEAFRTLRSAADRFAAIERQLREQNTATRSLFRERSGFALEDTTTRVQLQRRQVEGTDAVNDETEGNLFQARENLRTQFETVQRLAGVGGTGRAFSRLTSRVLQSVDVDSLVSDSDIDRFRRGALRNGADPSQVENQLSRLVELQQEVLELDRAASRPKPRVSTTKPEGVN